MSHHQQGHQASDEYIPTTFNSGPWNLLSEDVDFASFVDLDATRTDQVLHDETFSSEFGVAAPAQRTSLLEGTFSDNVDIWGVEALTETSSWLDAPQATNPLGDDISTAHSSACTSLDGFQNEGQDDPASFNTPERPQTVKKSRRLPVDSVRVLRTWFHEHRNYPYPNSSEVKALEQQSKLNKTQILNWFTNARRRYPTGKELSQSVPTADHTLLSPLERWQHSPPESEPAETRDIIRAAEMASFLPTANEPIHQSMSDGWSSNSSGSSLQFGAPSMSSYEHSNSSGSELSFSQSNEPFRRPPTPLPTMRPRRRRRKQLRQTQRLDRSTGSEKRKYQCTFCSDEFRNKYDWQRHERALHISVDLWNCAPDGGIIEVNGISTCVFCSAPNPDDDHLETHDYLRCRENPPELRAFSRKDHLQQHLRLVHNVSYNASMDCWRESKVQLLSRCGFCDSNFTTWEERVDHIAGHFKNNADMRQWHGGWGFEPHVESTVENAIPPYLLGLERYSMNPWVASNTGIPEVERPQTYQAAPNILDLYAYLREGLSTYIRSEVSAGNNPSDETIQAMARVLAYGVDDPFNQTYADAPDYIMLLRQELGIPPPEL